MSAVADAPSRPWHEPQLLDGVGETPAARLLAIVASLPPRTRFTANDLRHRFDVAGIPNQSRGPLMQAARDAGLIEVSTFSMWGQHMPERVPSTGRSANRATVLVYRRTAPSPAPAASP